MPLLTDNSGHPLVATTRGHGRTIGHRRRGAVRVTRAVGSAFALLYTALVLRLLLEFFHADGSGGIIGVFAAVTNLFIGPFRLIGHRRDIGGQFTLDIPILAAIAGYAIVHVAVNRLVHRAAERRRIDAAGDPAAIR